MDIVTYNPGEIVALLPEHPDALADARAIVSDPQLAAQTPEHFRRLAWAVLKANRGRAAMHHPRGTAA